MTFSSPADDAVVIAGVGESVRIGHVPDRSSLSLAAEAAQAAVADAGIPLSTVDGLFTARLSPMTLAEYLGITPECVDGTWTGGGSFVTHVLHAAAAIYARRCSVALIVHGQSGRSARQAPLMDSDHLPHGNVIDSPDPNQPYLQYEFPYGLIGAAPQYALSLSRYMALYGEDNTRHALATIAMAARRWAAITPGAFRPELLTREDYEQAPMIAWPLNQYDCCVVTDAGGAVVVCHRERAADLTNGSIRVVAGSEFYSHAMISQMPELTETALARTGPEVLRRAGLSRSDIDLLLIYDAFTHSVLIGLEDLGYCDRGEGNAFLSSTDIGPGGSLPLNTNGGGLAYTHTGMYGVFLLIEAVHQLRGTAGARQIPACSTALVNAFGGIFSSAASLVLATQ